MTFNEIKQHLAGAGKAVSDVQLYRYMQARGIKALAPLTIPRNYPDTAGEDLAVWLNLTPIAIVPDAPLRTATAALAKLPTLKQLRTERKKARGK